jgi:hypothetical protein
MRSKQHDIGNACAELSKRALPRVGEERLEPRGAQVEVEEREHVVLVLDEEHGGHAAFFAVGCEAFIAPA